MPATVSLRLVSTWLAADPWYSPAPSEPCSWSTAATGDHTVIGSWPISKSM